VARRTPWLALGMLLLEADVLHLILETLGAIEFTRATSCHPWHEAATSLPPDHALWKQACEADSPLLLARHLPNVTWKALVRQRRRALRAVEQEREMQGLSLAYELHNGAISGCPIVRTGQVSLDDCNLHDEDVTRLVLSTPLKVTRALAKCLLLQLYLIGPGPTHKMCCLDDRKPNDMDGFDVWWNFQPTQATRFRLRMKARYGPEFDIADADYVAENLLQVDEHDVEWLSLTALDVQVDLDDGSQYFGDYLMIVHPEATSPAPWTAL